MKHYQKPRIYWIYDSMMQRCLNPSCHAYGDYGGRGITVCETWRNSFDAFKRWAFSNGYREDLSIDRINNDGNYSPRNCRWATAKEQANNRRTCNWVELNGKRMTVKQVAEETGIAYRSLLSRLHRGWTIEKAVEKPINENYRRMK